LAFLPPPEGRHLRQLGIHHWCFHNWQVPGGVKGAHTWRSLSRGETEP
jgi:hypothetical protein